MKLMLASAALFVASSIAIADTVVLNNGDTLNGKIGQVTSATLEFTSPAFGKVNIPVGNLKMYKFDAPVKVQPKHATAFTDTVSGAGTDAKVGEKQYPLDALKYINPPAQEWTGAVIANLAVARGNTNKMTVGAEANAALRREDEWFNDRYTLGAGYNFGRSGGGASGDEAITDTNNWQTTAKWDKFWSEKLYGYTNVKLEHDAIADLYYRVTPGVGLGYQWLEGPKTNFNTEAGFSYVHEAYNQADGTVDNNDSISLRFAYHLEHLLSDNASLFHNLEYVPAIDDPGDYNLAADIGMKFKITGNFLAQIKLEYRRDSTPADEALKNDLLWTMGLGWQF